MELDPEAIATFEAELITPVKTPPYDLIPRYSCLLFARIETESLC